MKDEKSLLRFTTTGSVDDGKSTLIGRLLYETNCIFEDQYLAVEKTTKKRGGEDVDLALLLDGLAAEREQGITIDVAYRYFSTNKRKFIIADTPGHEQYTRNMVTGASTAQLALILIDARKGVLTQSKRHGFILSLLQIPHLVVCVNKMDLVDYSRDVFENIVKEYSVFSEKLDFHDITYIPLSALKGDNVTGRSENMKWYDGNTLLHHLETVHVSADRNLIDFRFPVQSVLRPDHDFRGFAGKIVSGTIARGERISVLPSGKSSVVKSIVSFEGELEEAAAPESVVITLEDEIDISRGDMIVREKNLPLISNKFDAMICWMDENPLKQTGYYILQHTTKSVKAFVSELTYRIDVNTLHRHREDSLKLNEIGRVEFKTSQPIHFDPYKINSGTGSFILIDPDTNLTVASGMIKGVRTELNAVNTKPSALSMNSTNVVWEKGVISLPQWEERNGHKAFVIWFTGLSGSGKSTVANKVGQELFGKNFQIMILDGDNLRHGICGDLTFTDKDRSENIRRAGEIAKLFMNQGNIVLCTFISPFKQDREFVKSLIPEGKFIEIYVKCDISVCINRDKKGLYDQAKKGLIKDFTGVSSLYDEPANPDVILETDKISINECKEQVWSYLKRVDMI